MKDLAFLYISIALCAFTGCATPELEKASSSEAVTAALSQGNTERYSAISNTVYFAYDKYDLNSETVSVIRNLAKDLRTRTSIQIRIEGHCDERGTREYNLALGERRAQAVEDLLILNGISPNDITTISYGEERPVEIGSGELIWSQNRRSVIKTSN
tara:strand:+ start:835 stop:1305 length:471 start_codon:yes stop_codon:yes gene_type:complete